MLMIVRSNCTGYLPQHCLLRSEFMGLFQMVRSRLLSSYEFLLW